MTKKNSLSQNAVFWPKTTVLDELIDINIYIQSNISGQNRYIFAQTVSFSQNYPFQPKICIFQNMAEILKPSFFLPNYSAETKLISSCPLQERAPAKRDALGGAPRSGKRAGELPAHHSAPPGHQPGTQFNRKYLS